MYIKTWDKTIKLRHLMGKDKRWHQHGGGLKAVA